MNKIVGELRSAQHDMDNFPRMPQERCVSVELAERSAQEIERLESGLNEQIQWVSDLADDLIQAEKKIKILRDIIEAADDLRVGIREAGVKRDPLLYLRVMVYDGMRSRLDS